MSFLTKIKAKLNIKSRRQLILLIILTVTLVSSLTLGAITLARYISEKNSDGLLTPEKFYFESNLLSEAGAEYNIGTDSITFDLKSYVDSLRTSEVDITYSVAITCTDGSVSIPDGVNTAGTLSSGASKVTVQYNGLPLGKTYTVTASATAPYTKSISATFTLPNENDAVIMTRTQDETGFISYLTLKTGNIAKSGVILWQNGYVPYNAYEPMKNAGGSSHNVTLEPNSTYVFSFFKSQLSTEYDSGAFNFCLPEELPDFVLKENYALATGISDNGQWFYLQNGANPTNDYSISGYMDITRSDLAYTPHIQFKIRWSDFRFLLWDSNKNGKFGYGYIWDYDSENKNSVNENSNLSYPDALDLTNGPITIKWQVVVTGGRAYWYIDNRLIFDLDLGGYQCEIFNIGALRADFSLYGVELIAKSENEASFNSVLESLGITE